MTRSSNHSHSPRPARCRVAVLALSAAWLAGGCTELLDDDFEDYAPGSAVGGPIPGAPGGDEIIAEGSPNLYAVSTSSPLSGDQSLLLREAAPGIPCDGGSIPCEDPFKLTFAPVAPDDDGRDLYFSWRGRFVSPTDASTMRVAIVVPGDGLFDQTVVRFDIERDQIEARNGSGLQGFCAEQLPDSGDPVPPSFCQGDFRTSHSVLVRLSLPDGTYGVEIVGGGVDPQNNALVGTIPSPGDISVEDLALTMNYIGASSLSVRYRVDNVNIDQRAF